LASIASTSILIVDDNDLNLRVLRETLRPLGHRILLAKNGHAAVQIANRDQPALILLDIVMPEMNGFDVCKRLKANDLTADIPIIFISAVDETASKIEGFALGAVDYVTKPFEPDEILARVTTHLALHQLKNQLQENNRRMREELALAAQLQHSVLPHQLPQDPRLLLSWKYQPCDELGGDALDCFRLDDDHIALSMLDVNGHGVGAALMSFSLSSNLRADQTARAHSDSLTGISFDPSGVLQRLNRTHRFDSNHRGLQLFTMVYAVLDLRDGSLDYACAGHPGPILIRAGQRPVMLDATAPPLGIFDELAVAHEAITLKGGDLFYFVTDGLHEQRDENGELFGLERMTDSLAVSRESTLECSIDALFQKVLTWSASGKLIDDAAALGFEYLGDA
jgi:sigma-B regulation protein RsbU (phosphoserine phosphatase)